MKNEIKEVIKEVIKDIGQSIQILSLFIVILYLFGFNLDITIVLLSFVIFFILVFFHYKNIGKELNKWEFKKKEDTNDDRYDKF